MFPSRCTTGAERELPQDPSSFSSLPWAPKTHTLPELSRLNSFLCKCASAFKPWSIMTWKPKHACESEWLKPYFPRRQCVTCVKLEGGQNAQLHSQVCSALLQKDSLFGSAASALSHGGCHGDKLLGSGWANGWEPSWDAVWRASEGENRHASTLHCSGCTHRSPYHKGSTCCWGRTGKRGLKDWLPCGNKAGQEPLSFRCRQAVIPVSFSPTHLEFCTPVIFTSGTCPTLVQYCVLLLCSVVDNTWAESC